MPDQDRLYQFPGAITVCNEDGAIVYMNERSREVFRADGGERLLGANVLDCHPEPARSKLLEIMANKSSNVYTIEKNGKKKLIYQAPWYDQGVFGGLVELALELPENIPHFIRK